MNTIEVLLKLQKKFNEDRQRMHDRWCDEMDIPRRAFGGKRLLPSRADVVRRKWKWLQRILDNYKFVMCEKCFRIFYEGNVGNEWDGKREKCWCGQDLL